MATITIADNDARVQYTQAVTANVTQLTIDFPFFDLDDINVIVTSAAGVDTTLSRGTGTGTFAVTGTSVDDGYSGGYITLGDSYADASTKYTIFRDIPVARTTDFPTSGPFNVSSLNTELDKIFAVEQELETKITRTLQLSDSDSTVDLKLPNLDTRKGTVLAFNATTGVPEAGPTISDVSTVAAITADIATLADIEDGTDATDAIQTVAGISSNVTTVAGISSNVTTVAGISADVTSVAADATNIGTVASNIASVNTVAGNISEVIAVANDLNEAVSEVETVANDLNEAVSEIETVAASITNVDTVGTNISNVNTVAGNSTNINTVAGISSNVTTVAGISGNVTTVAGISSDVTTVAADGTDIGTVATNISNVNTVAGISSNVTTVAGNNANVTTVASNIADVNTVAGSITDVNTFAVRYRIASSAPTTSLDEGDLYFNTTDNQMYVYTGSAWVAVSPDIVADITPQLGGNLDTNGNDITFGDNDKAIFGAGSDLQIYHDGTHSYIKDAGTGDIRILADNNVVIGDSAYTENKAVFQTNGAVTLYYDGSPKIATTSGGIDVTGTVTADGIDVQGDGTISGGSRLTISDIADVNNDGIRLDDNTTSRYNNLSQDTSGNFVLQHFTGSTWQNNLTVTTAGNVGIGTASPSEELTISKSDDARISITSSGTGKAAMTGLLEFDGSDGRHGYIGPVGGVMRLNTDGGYDILFQPGGTEKVRIKSTGNVGIGDTSPDAKLDVYSTSGSTTDIGRFEAAVGGYTGTSLIAANTLGPASTYNLFKCISDSDGDGGGPYTEFVVRGDGNVGIGTAAPAGELHLYRNSTGPCRLLLQNTEDLSYIYSDGGQLIFDSDNGHLFRNENGTTEFGRFDSSGHLLVGTTTSRGTRATIEGSSALVTAQGVLDVNSTDALGTDLGATISLGGVSTGAGGKSRYAVIGGRKENATDGNYAGYFQIATTNGSGTTSERMRIDSSGNVGIGTAAPGGLMEVYVASGQSGSQHGYRLITADGGGYALYPTSAVANPTFMHNVNSGESQAFGEGGLERARIDSSGNLLVGGTDVFPHDNAATSGTAIGASGYISIARDGGIAGYFNRMTSDGDILQFRKGGSTVGSIGAVSGDIYIGTGDTTLRFYDAGNSITPRGTDGAANNGVIDLGGSSERFKDLYLSGGVYLGGTGASNLLDDYEEGTWTPQLRFGGGTTGMVTSTQQASYTKIGRQVHVQFRFAYTTKGSSTGNATISGLPFTPSGGAINQGYPVGGFSFESNGSTTTPVSPFCLAWSDSLLYLRANDGAGTQYTNLTDSKFGTTSEIWGSIVYRI